jgi:hypothetical protein
MLLTFLGSQTIALGQIDVYCVAANKGGKVFWSGSPEARGAAEAFAKQTYGKTLEMTKTGKVLDAITTQKTYPYVKPLWDQASKNFAKGAGEAIDVFQSANGVRLKSVWATQEYPQLMKQGTNSNRPHYPPTAKELGL